MRIAYTIKHLDWKREGGDLFAKTPFVEYQISADDFDGGYTLLISTPLSVSPFVGCEYFTAEGDAKIGAVIHLFDLLSPILTDVSEYIEWV
jgi:hypothetical protein